MSVVTRDEQAGVEVRPHVTILTDRCAGCQECSVRCPSGALTLEAGRWVVQANDELCVGCRQCERTCPFSAITIEGPMLVAPRAEFVSAHHELEVGDASEMREGFASWTEALAEASRCLTCPDPTCVRGCPAHNDIPGFIAAIRARDLGNAHEILHRTTVLSDVCSRVCNQAAQCEGSCTWSLAGGVPVAIGRLERFINDQSPTPMPVAVAPIDLSIGIIGAGPAALGAAWELVEGGALVTVYERDAEPGGLMRWGIPDFTLPDEVAMRGWRQLQAAGVDVRCGVDVAPEQLDAMLHVHDGLVLAYGASEPLHLRVPGAELDGVSDATSFLKGVKAALEPGGDVAAFRASLGLGPDLSVGATSPRVLVLGAGNTAMDVARSARRLGLEATCVDWLDERFSLARPDELEEARGEGVRVRFLSTLVSLEGHDGRVRRAVLSHTQQKSASERPVVIEGAVFHEDVDLVVMAMGYRIEPALRAVAPGTPVAKKAVGVPDRRWVASGIMAHNASAFANHNPVGPLALGREIGLERAALAVRERTWVAGDALVGPSTVVEAMAQGRRAARAVLAAMPAREGHEREARAMNVLVCYASHAGTTARVASAIGDGLIDSGHNVRVMPIAKVGVADLAWATQVAIGTWVEGLVVAKVGPSKAMTSWIDALPPLGATPVGLFCTYAVSPKQTLESMKRGLEARGANVVAQAAFGRSESAMTSGPFSPLAFGRELSERFERTGDVEVAVS